MKKTVVLDLDDFSVLNNRLDLLLRLKESYPKLKVTLFTIPYDIAYEQKVEAKIIREGTLKAIKRNLDWMEIVPHGLVHMPREFEKCDYETMMKHVFPAIEEAFSKDGLPYVKGFKAPHWLWNEDVIKALDEKGWWGAVDRKYEGPTTKKFYRFSHSIDEPFSRSSANVLKLHGHITGESKNYIEKCFPNLFNMPTDADFKFASELLEKK